MSIKLLRKTSLIWVLLSSITVHAATLSVVSNADAGPGTFRQAILDAAANGTNSTDTITFQIADQTRNGRTILLNSELPALSSNLIIDGSTQPGTAIGVSGARIILQQANAVGPAGFTFLKCYGASNVQLYGLFLLNSWWSFNVSSPDIRGLDFSGCKSVIIGAPGKGNYIRGVRYAFSSQPLTPSDSSVNIIIQSNILGNDETGGIENTFPYNAVLYNINTLFRFKDVHNITIGGSSPAEGNTAFALKSDIKSSTGINNGFINIANNNFNLTINGDLDTDGSSGNEHDLTISGGDYLVNFKRNRLNGTIILSGITRYFFIQGNKILVPMFLSSNPKRIAISGCTAGGLIGGDDPSDANEIFTNNTAFNYYGVSSPDQQDAILNDLSPNLTIKKNSIYCTCYFASSISHNFFNQGTFPVPYVRIDSTGVNFVRGKATPACRVEVFLDDNCPACEGKTFLGFTASAADSTWSYTGNFNAVVVATATNASGVTSEFSTPQLITNNVKVNPATCGRNNGSITGMQAVGFDRVEWRHKYGIGIQDSVISTQFNIYNLAPGTYYCHAWLGTTCRGYYASYTISALPSPRLDTTTKQVVQPTCGQNNGSIKNIFISGYDNSKYYWKNSAGITFAATKVGNQLQLLNAAPGSYKLILQDTLGGCADSTNWINLINQSGPSLNINGVSTTNASCSLANGSITGIQTTNTQLPVIYRWIDSSGIVVSSSIDLINIRAGKYRLKFKDAGGCDTITSPVFIVLNNGVIKIDTSSRVIKATGCGVANGSISGLVITGADNLIWKDASGVAVANAADLQGVASGNYLLTASNSSGCVATAGYWFVPQANFQSVNVTSYQVVNAYCNRSNGAINSLQFSQPANFYQFQWKDSITNALYNSAALANLAAGTYQLYATDSNNCSKKIFSTQVIQLGSPVVNTSSIAISNDLCNQMQGSILGLQASAGSGNPYTIQWYDGNLNSVNNSKLLAGDYHAVVTDVKGCQVSSPVYTVKNDTTVIDKPRVDDQVVFRGTTAAIVVKNPGNYTYWLYDTIPTGSPVQTNSRGVFTTSPISYNKKFYIRSTIGDCSSDISEIQITVFDNTEISVPNAFSPNGDGINDRWQIQIKGYFKAETFIVFDRYGCAVCKPTHPNPSWDGTIRGRPAAPGTYYYFLKGRGASGELIQRNGFVVLVR